MTALAVVGSVAILAGCALKALQMWLRHREKKLEHAPLAQMQSQLDAIEARMVAGAMRGR